MNPEALAAASAQGHHEAISGRLKDPSKRLSLALAISLAFVAVEVVGGILSGSLALLADAGHMLTDVGALAVALLASRLAQLPRSPKRTFGLLRAEVFAAFINGVGLVVVVGFILTEAADRLRNPAPVEGPLVMAVAAAGLAANLCAAAVLHPGHRHSINLKAAYAHVVADALGSLAALAGGALVWLSGWTPADTLASVAIGLLILYGSVRLLSESTGILLQSTPGHIDFASVHRALAGVTHVEEVYDLHIWTITSGMPALSAHLRLAPSCSHGDHWHRCLAEAQRILRDRFGIVHSTLQVEPPEYERDQREV